MPDATTMQFEPGWDKRGTGRRLILFPDLLAEDGATEGAIEDVVLNEPRTLILVPSNRAADEIIAEYQGRVTIMRAPDVEEDLRPFTEAQAPAALVLANRYDGIDLPGETCRMLVLRGLPAATNLQERFMLERLRAVAHLRDRIRTRITQGVGRCTRDEADYALVLLVGTDLLKWCSTAANVRGMHPELQAEIAFGLDNSVDRTVEDFRQLRQALLAQDENWALADDDIVARRDDCVKQPDEVATALRKAVAHELGYIYALWRHDFDRAYEEACAAVDALEGGKDLIPYRAFWQYEAAVAANWAWRRSAEERWRNCYAEHVRSAVSTTPHVPWLAGLRDMHGPDQQKGSTVSVIQISRLLEEWKPRGGTFERRVKDARDALGSDTADVFHRGLAMLGRMLGCEPYIFTESGAPDGLWLLIDGHCVVFEAKTDEDPRGAVSLETVRQAVSHVRWVQAKKLASEKATIDTVLITPRTMLYDDARIQSDDLYCLHTSEVRELFEHALATLQVVRPKVIGVTEEQESEIISAEYRTHHLTHTELLAALLRRRLTELSSPRRVAQDDT